MWRVQQRWNNGMREYLIFAMFKIKNTISTLNGHNFVHTYQNPTIKDALERSERIEYN